MVEQDDGSARCSKRSIRVSQLARRLIVALTLLPLLWAMPGFTQQPGSGRVSS